MTELAFDHRKPTFDDFGEADDPTPEDMVLAGFVICLECKGQPVVEPDLHDYWHRTGRAAIDGLRSGEIGEPA